MLRRLYFNVINNRLLSHESCVTEAMQYCAKCTALTSRRAKKSDVLAQSRLFCFRLRWISTETVEADADIDQPPHRIMSKNSALFLVDFLLSRMFFDHFDGAKLKAGVEIAALPSHANLLGWRSVHLSRCPGKLDHYRISGYATLMQLRFASFAVINLRWDLHSQ